VHSPWSLLIPAFALLHGFMFASIAILVTSLVPSIYSFTYYFSVFIAPMFFFSGVFFPLTSFPVSVQRLSWIAPLTPEVQMTRALVSGQFSSALALPLGLVLLLTALFFLVALISMRRRLTL
jgi:lipooligosaccharide transport system permease protein